jgi:hypothetical protein
MSIKPSQAHCARYCGLRKSLFDLRRAAIVHDLHIIARSPDESKVA